MSDYRYDTIPDYPDGLTAAHIICRLLDSLGYRFYWATEGLREADYNFRPCKDGKNISELVSHLWGLINWVSIGVYGRGTSRPVEITGQRDHISELVYRLRETFDTMDTETLDSIRLEGKPVWNIINGPLSDALTHVGQINMLRRIAGYPPWRNNPFLGIPPSDM